jgi:hypothetical protein
VNSAYGQIESLIVDCETEGVEFIKIYNLYTSLGWSSINYNGNLLHSLNQQKKDLGHENVLLNKQYRTATKKSLETYICSFVIINE